MSKITAFILAVMMVMSSAFMIETSVNAAENPTVATAEITNNATTETTAATANYAITGASVTLDEGVVLNVTLSEGIDSDDVSFWLKDECLQNGGTSLRLSAARMADLITIAYKKGTADEELHNFSIMNYAQKARDMAYSNRVKEMLDAMLVYGGAAQRFFGYTGQNEGGLDADANCQIVYEQPVIGDEHQTVFVPGNIVTGAAATLMLADKINIVVTLENAKELEVTSEGTVKVTGNDVTVTIPVNPRDLDKMYTVTASDGTSVKYSALTYIKNMFGKKENPEFDDLLAAIYQYNLNAENYVLSETDYWNKLEKDEFEQKIRQHWKNTLHINTNEFSGPGTDESGNESNVFVTEQSTVTFSGSVASKNSDITGFKYSVDNGPLRDGEKVKTEQTRVDSVHGLGADFLSDFLCADVEIGEYGNHLVFIYATYEDGTTELVWAANVSRCYFSEEGVIEIQPDCLTSGLNKYYCTIEGCDRYRTETVAALGHDYAEDGRCIRCGEYLYIETIPFTGEMSIDSLWVGSVPMMDTDENVKPSVNVTQVFLDSIYMCGSVTPDKPVEAFGYAVGNGPAIFNIGPGQSVNGEEYTKQIDVSIPTDAFTLGANFIRFFVKLDDGSIYTLWQSVINVVPANEPAYSFNLFMLETTGEYNPSWKNGAGYSDNVIFLLPNQTDNTVGYINLGNIDFSQYKYCAISYGTVVEADFGGSGLKADTPCVFGLTTDGESYGVTDKGTPPIVPGDNTLAYNACVNTSATWNAGTRIMIIDLTNVTYSGKVYVSFSTTTGNGVVVSSIAFYS